MFVFCSLIFLTSGCGVSTPAAQAPSDTGHHQVDLSWDAPESSPVQVVGYHVYRAPAGSSAYQLLNTSLAVETVYLDTTVQSGLSLQLLCNECRWLRRREWPVEHRQRDNPVSIIVSPTQQAVWL